MFDMESGAADGWFVLTMNKMHELNFDHVLAEKYVDND